MVKLGDDHQKRLFSGHASFTACMKSSPKIKRNSSTMEMAHLGVL